MEDFSDIDTATKWQIAFEYYKQQREEMARLAQERTSLTLQLVVISGALVALSFEDAAQTLRSGIALLVIILGFIGLAINWNIERSSRSHMKRAQAARESIGLLEPFASSARTFGTVHIHYYLMSLSIMLIGIFLNF